MSQEEELDETKRLIRAAIISCQDKLTINEFCRQYKDFDEGGLPFRKFNFPNAYEFLRSMPDTVQLLDPTYFNSYIRPVTNEKTQHVHKLVQEQKRTHAKKLPYRGSGPTHYRGNNFQPAPRFERRNNVQRRPDSFDRSVQPQQERLVLTREFKLDLLKLIQNYPHGVPWDEFDSHTQRILGNHYLKGSSNEVLEKMTDLAFYENGRVFSTHSPNSIDHEQVPEDENNSIVVISDSSETDIDEGISSASRSPGSTKNRDNESSGCSLISDRLQDNLRALLMDYEHANGIWLNKLPLTYERKFGYPLSPREHGFADVMDLVANAKTIFHMKQYRNEGDYLLQDARKFPPNEDTEEENNAAHIPRAVVEELKKILRPGPIYVDDLSQEYRKTFQRELRPKEFGFKDLDQFLLYLENTCRDIVFRRVRDQTLMRLNYAFRDTTNSLHPPDTANSSHQSDSANSSRHSPCETLPRNDTYGHFPAEVCNADFRLEIDPYLADSKVGQIFPVNFGEVHSPGSFYITHMNRMELLENMMADLNQFYAAHGDKYRVPLSMVFRDLLCACTYSKNNQWHRVRVLSCTLKCVKISFIDYGTMEEGVNIENLRYLHKDFAEFPAFCMQARLSGIEPNDGVAYSTSVKEAFYELFGGSNLDAEVVRHTPNSLEIILYAVSEDDKRTAAHEILLRKKLVRRKITDIKVSPPGGKSSLSRLPSDTLLRGSSRNGTLNEETLRETEETASFKSEVAANVEEATASTCEPSSFLGAPLKPPPGFLSSPALLTSQYQSCLAQTQNNLNPYAFGAPNSFYPYYNNPSMMRANYMGAMYPPYYPTYPMPPYSNMYQSPYMFASPSPNLLANTISTPSAFRRPPPGIRPPPTYFNLPSTSELPNVASVSENRVTSPPARRGDDEDSSDSSVCESCLTKKVSPGRSKPDDKTVEEIMEKLSKFMSTHKSESGVKSRESEPSTPRFEDVDSIISCAKEAAEKKVMEYLLAGEQHGHKDDAYIVPDRNVPSLSSTFQLNACSSEFIPKTKPRTRTVMNDTELLPNTSSSAKGVSSESEKRDTCNTPDSTMSNGSPLPILEAQASAIPSPTPTFAANRLNSIRSFVLQREKNNASSSQK